VSDAPSVERRQVTVIVVTYQSGDVVGDCLRSIPAAFAGLPAPCVVVVDNASTDSTATEVATAAPDVLFHRLADNLGYAAAINAGLEVSTDRSGGAVGPVLVLNPDIRLQAGSAAPLVAALDVAGVGIAVPRIVDEDGTIQLSLRREPSLLRTAGEAVLGGHRAGRFPAFGEVVTDPAEYERPGNVDWATGATMLVSAACFDAVGRWDESGFLFSEEVDFALRARDAGFEVRYEPASTVVHLSGSSSTVPELWPLVVQNKLRLYRSRHGRIRSAAFTTATVANEAVRAAAGRPANRAALRMILTRSDPDPRPHAAQSERRPGSGMVCFSAQDWWYFNRAHSDFQLLTRVAQVEPVLLVNSLGMRMPKPGLSTKPATRIVRKLKSLTRGLRRPLADTPGFAVLTPLFIPVYTPGRVRDFSNLLVRKQVEWAARRIGITDPTVMVTLPTAWEAAQPIRRSSLIANRSDRYSAFGEADEAWVSSLERDLLEHADVAVYASQSLLDAEAHLTSNPMFLDHGVDLDRFVDVAEIEPAPALARIPGPRIGFFGAIDDYTVDLPLLRRIATEIPEASLVLVGPTNCSLDEVTSLPNVHWLGACEPHEVPAFGAGFDVALMPWLANDWIAHCNPIKVKEYLALGLPIVSTAYPDVERYRGLLRVARSSTEFVALVRQTLVDGGPSTPEKRRQAVAGDSWDRRAVELMEMVDRPEMLACADS